VKQDSKIYVAGHRGLAGSALVRGLQARGYRNLVTRTHAELDLIEQRAVREFFQRERPEVVFLAAAKVGGIVGSRRSASRTWSRKWRARICASPSATSSRGGTATG